MSELELNIGKFVIGQVSSKMQSTLHRKYKTLTTQQAVIDQVSEMIGILQTAIEKKCAISESMSKSVERNYNISKVLEQNLVNNRLSNEVLLKMLQQNYITMEGLYTTVKYPGRLGLDLTTAVNLTSKSCEALQCGLEDNCEISNCLNASLLQSLDSNKTVMDIFRQSNLSHNTVIEETFQTMKTDVALAATMQENWFVDQKLKSAHELNYKTMIKLETCLQNCIDTFFVLDRARRQRRRLPSESEDTLEPETTEQRLHLETSDISLSTSVDTLKCLKSDMNSLTRGVDTLRVTVDESHTSMATSLDALKVDLNISDISLSTSVDLKKIDLEKSNSRLSKDKKMTKLEIKRIGQPSPSTSVSYRKVERNIPNIRLLKDADNKRSKVGIGRSSSLDMKRTKMELPSPDTGRSSSVDKPKVSQKMSDINKLYKYLDKKRAKLEAQAISQQEAKEKKKAGLEKQGLLSYFSFKNGRGEEKDQATSSIRHAEDEDRQKNQDHFKEAQGNFFSNIFKFFF